MDRSKFKRLAKEVQDYGRLVVWCIKCRGKNVYKAMPGTTTCLKHKPPMRRCMARKLLRLSKLTQEVGQ